MCCHGHMITEHTPWYAMIHMITEHTPWYVMIIETYT